MPFQIWLTLTGFAVGSFLNVLIYRVPQGRSILRPGSTCACGQPIPWYRNVPVVSWLVLRGRAACCQNTISVQYPLVEAATGLVFAAIAWGTRPALWAMLCYLAAISICLTVIDIQHLRLPNAVVYPSYALMGVCVAIAAVVDGTDDWQRALLGMAVFFGFFLLIRLVYPPGMGLGDVKLSGVLGLVLGYFGFGSLVVGMFAGFFVGAAGSIALMLFTSTGRKSRIPYGPYLLAGTWCGVLWGQDLATWYLQLTGL